MDHALDKGGLMRLRDALYKEGKKKRNTFEKKKKS